MNKSIDDLVKEDQDQGNHYDWFNRLYLQADRDTNAIPWAKLQAHPALVSWLNHQPKPIEGETGLVIGCGLGDDAECIQQQGYATTAFDVAASAIAWCQTRFPQSSVNYEVGDLFTWPTQADLVIEHRTVQALPLTLRTEAIDRVCSLVAPGGQLVVLTNTRGEETSPDGPPWPLSPKELDYFEQGQLKLQEKHFPGANQAMLIFKHIS